MSYISINGKKIGNDAEPFIIAEAGINHNGDIELAKKMVLAAKDAKVDAVKFQTFHAEEFISDENETYTYFSQGKEITESMLNMFKRYEFSDDEWMEIKSFCDENDIVFLSTPQNVSDLDILLRLGISAIKIGSDDFVNIPLIKRYANEGLPLLLSCGMANEEEIDRALKAAGYPNHKDICLLLCTSQYPTPPNDINAKKLISLSKKYPDLILGFSDHSQGNTAAVVAVALGARIFEKHFTLSHDFVGPDHWFSSTPDELKTWVESIRLGYSNLGSYSLQPTSEELEMRKIAHRSVTVLMPIKHGEKFSVDNIGLRRPGTGISPEKYEIIIGKVSKRDLEVGYQLTAEDIQ